MYQWARDSYALFATLGLGYAGWFVLLAGVIAVIRASGRGRTGWEALGVLLVALVPAGWATLLNYYHPQDLVAMGLLLAAVACVERRHWVWAGVLLGLAVTSQQFVLLVLAPLVVVAPGRDRWRLLISSGAAAALFRCRCWWRRREERFTRYSSERVTRRHSAGRCSGSCDCTDRS